MTYRYFLPFEERTSKHQRRTFIYLYNRYRYRFFVWWIGLTLLVFGLCGVDGCWWMMTITTLTTTDSNRRHHLSPNKKIIRHKSSCGRSSSSSSSNTILDTDIQPMDDSSLCLNNNDEKLSSNDRFNGTLYQNWKNHNDVSFHYLSPTKAFQIQQALLHWYHQERRKLPWRGDPPPYDGSTAGWNQPATTSMTTTTSKVTDTIPSSSTCKTSKPAWKRTTLLLGNYVVRTTKTAKAKSMTNKSIQQNDPLLSSSSSSSQEAAIPVTAYGVWVSEIMLQQTRVEAVIPYWLQCK